MRLIDADEMMANHCANCLSGSFKRCWFGDNGMCKTRNEVEVQPTVDPVKRGYWIDLSSPDHIIKGATYKCSECGEGEFYPHKFCPNCGAYMSGDMYEID